MTVTQCFESMLHMSDEGLRIYVDMLLAGNASVESLIAYNAIMALARD